MRSRAGAVRSQDGGFVLLESMIAISLITIIMSALAVLFVNGIANVAHERMRAGASRVATTMLDDLNSRDATSLVSGRTTAGQFATASSAVAPYLTSMTEAKDTDPNSTGVPTVATTPIAQTIGSVVYTANRYLGWCLYSLAADGTGSCVKSASCPNSGGTACYLRAVVAVSWAGSNCTPASCTYVTSTLISAKIDPTFKVNQPLPAAPVAVNPGAQSSAVGDTVSLQMQAQTNTGVPPLTWTATGLPGGLAINPAGLISNGAQPLVQNSAPATVTVTVTDAFLRQNTVTFSWRVYLQLVPTTPAPQSGLTATSVNVALHAVGGQGAPYTWTLAAGALPQGLTVNSTASGDGSITGTPTTPGQYSFTLTVADASTTRTATTSTITWTVAYPPLVPTTPAPQSGLTTTSVNVALHAVGGQGAPYTWRLATGALPPGLTVNSAASGDGSITGTPTTPGQYSFTLTVADASTTRTATTSTITWTVAYPPIIGSNPGPQTDTLGTNRGLQLSASGGSGSAANYRWTSPDNSLAATGLSISSSGLISGTLTSTAKDVSVTLTVSDPTAGVTNTLSFVWHVVAKPTLASPGTQAMTETGVQSGSRSFTLGYTCANGPCTVTLTNAPPGLGLDTVSTQTAANSTTQLTVATGSGSVYVDGLVSTTAVTTGNAKLYTPTVTIIDSDAAATTPAAGNWTVNVAPTLAFAPTSTAPQDVEVPLNRPLSGAGAAAGLGTPGYSYAFSGSKPSWLSINAGTGALSGTTPALRQAFTFTVVATDADNVSVSATATWYADDLAITLPTSASFARGSSALGLSVSFSGSGGNLPYTYAAANLPTGVTMLGSGTATGTFTTRGTWITTVYVSDLIGTTVADTITVTVT